MIEQRLNEEKEGGWGCLPVACRAVRSARSLRDHEDQN